MQIIKENGKYYQNINKSKFLGFAYFVENEEQAINYIKIIQNKYCDCKHVVYAYKIEPNIIKKGNSSEPAGTAGTPILSIIEKNNLTNVLVVVVRYFGGILLGANNLYRAYESTAKGTLDNCKIDEISLYKSYTLKVDYSIYNLILNLSNKNEDLKILNTKFDNEVVLKIALKNEDKYEIIKDLIKRQKSKREDIWL